MASPHTPTVPAAWDPDRGVFVLATAPRLDQVQVDWRGPDRALRRRRLDRRLRRARAVTAWALHVILRGRP